MRDASAAQITGNAEIQNIKQILGLQHGKVYTDAKSLRYGHLMIMTDQVGRLPPNRWSLSALALLQQRVGRWSSGMGGPSCPASQGPALTPPSHALPWPCPVPMLPRRTTMARTSRA